MKKSTHTNNGETGATPNSNGEPPQLAPAPETHYGSSGSMADVLKVKDEPIYSPVVDDEFVRCLAAAVGAAAEDAIRSHHAHLFDEHNAELMTKCRHLQGHIAADNAGIARHQRELTCVNGQTARYHERSESGTPWTTSDGVKVAGLGVGSGLLLLVETNSVAQVLQASGIPGFENQLRCYLYSFIPVGLAMLFKVPSSYFATRKQLMAYIWLLFTAALCFGVCWVVLFAQTFPGMTMSTADLINSIGEARPGESAHLLIVVSLLAESMMAGVFWLTMEVIADKHEAARRLDCPAFRKTQDDLDHWQRRRFEQEEILAILHAKVQAIGHARERFIGQAVGQFLLALGNGAT